MVLTRLKAKSERKLAKQICKVVLDHFEKQYSKELGDAWNTVRNKLTGDDLSEVLWIADMDLDCLSTRGTKETMPGNSRRDILTSPSCWQHAILFNRFSYPFELEKDLHSKGYHTLFRESLPYYPKSMKCYLSSIPSWMPSERHQIGNLKKYYLLNAASLLPVLALELRDGEKVLDLCAAPGGKSVALLQCAYPGYLHCNEYDSLRLRWLRQTLESFIPQPLVNVIKVSELDGREMGDVQPEKFDKVLVDAPCSNDRSWLFSSDSQKAACRISQRRNLPVLQIELIRSAVKALRPGGLLVYSTCTLSKAENQDVISEILNSHSNVTPVDIKEMAATCSQDFTFAPTGQECGLLVIPDKGKAWGPMYVAKLKKSWTI